MSFNFTERDLTILRQPDLRFVISHPAYFLAFGCSSGLLKPAPGTWGTLVAFPFAWLWTKTGLPVTTMLIPSLLLFLIGIWACNKTSQALGTHDYGGIVIDEIVAMLFMLSFVPASWFSWCMAFILFRFFDIVKPWPIHWLDEKITGGIGIMLDDFAAGCFALVAYFMLSHFIYNYFYL